MAIVRCEAETKAGKRCKARAISGSMYCFAHDPRLAGKRAEWRRAGGLNSGKRAVMAEAASVQTPEAIRDLLARTIDSVQAGTMTAQTANAIGRLCSLQLRAIRDTDLARRLEDLERVVKSQR